MSFSSFIKSKYREVFLTLGTLYVLKGVSNKVAVSQFADDNATYIKWKSKRGQKLLTKSTQQIRKNLFELGLNFIPAKTKFMHFNNQKILPGETYNFLL